MLADRTLLDREGMRLADVACRHPRGRGAPGEQQAGHTVVFVRRGCFTRVADGAVATLDPTLAYCVQPGEEQRYDHPHDHGDDCTALTLTPELLASLNGGELALPRTPLQVSPHLDLAHRLLLAACRRGDDPHDLLERAILLTAATLERTTPRSVAAARPATQRARARLVSEAREVLAEDPNVSLTVLAAALSVSPHHLSRIFSHTVGHTLSRHKTRVRVRIAMEHLAHGETRLAHLAAEIGFSDQSHMCRSIRAETGHTPRALARLLA